MTLALALLAAVVAAIRAVVLQRRVRVLQEQAVTDPLTGAFNRRQMHLSLAEAIERHRRSGERASLLLIDIDRFKEINDRYGHAEGDRVLKALAALAGARLRRLDGLFRVGGEEFAVLLSGARLVEAFSVAEDLRALVQRSKLIGGRDVCISIGVTELACEQSLSAWIADADAALYRAKRGGRNRVAGSYRDPRAAETAGGRRAEVRAS
jgi:diguanylate cyclase (GGDEF)-like protein